MVRCGPFQMDGGRELQGKGRQADGGERMASVTSAYARKGARPFVAMDCSPPRSGDPSFAAALAGIEADFVCAAYSPGRSARMDPVAAAASVRRVAGIDAIFSLATRDMNRLAFQMHLLGAQALGLDNVLVLYGDEFSAKDLNRTRAVRDIAPTGLLADIRAMNEERDFKGLKLAAPTQLCAGAAIDLSKGAKAEAALAQRKVEAGAEFIIAQPMYDPAPRRDFLDCYESLAGAPFAPPVFWGVQLLTRDGLVFGDPPPRLVDEIAQGRPPADAAVEIAGALREAGADAFYVVPPILKGGARDYEAARDAIAAIKKL